MAFFRTQKTAPLLCGIVLGGPFKFLGCGSCLLSLLWAASPPTWPHFRPELQQWEQHLGSPTCGFPNEKCPWWPVAGRIWAICSAMVGAMEASASEASKARLSSISARTRTYGPTESYSNNRNYPRPYISGLGFWLKDLRFISALRALKFPGCRT